MKCISSTGVLNAEWRAGEMQSTPIGTPRASAISGVTLAPGSTPPWPGLAPCDSLISIILTCGSCACAANRSGQNAAVVVAAAEIAAADLPDQVAAEFAMIAADAAFAGVVREAAELGALVEGANGVRAERAEAHGGDVEERQRIGLAAVGAADRDAKVVVLDVDAERSND